MFKHDNRKFLRSNNYEKGILKLEKQQLLQSLQNIKQNENEMKQKKKFQD